ncbi:antiviral innate immune response receptor RIG-I-like [Ptychodera flava]|uniref:antiviral innate immune response receptor RIG-I-like n=1 Tax=Ptychodera flava TaxID=63121 RepID=UPI00396A66B1
MLLPFFLTTMSDIGAKALPDTTFGTEQQRALLLVFEPLLHVYLVPNTMLCHLTHMFSLDELSHIANVEKQRGRRAAVHSLVEGVLNMSDEYPDWFRIFMDALRSSDNGHIAEIIEGTSENSMYELENYKRHIRLFAPHLEVINPAEILPELTSILSDHDREQIKADQRNHGPRYAVLTLLDRLVKKTGDWFKDFLQALRNVGRDDLANLLHGPETTEQVICQETEERVDTFSNDSNDNSSTDSDPLPLDSPEAANVVESVINENNPCDEDKQKFMELLFSPGARSYWQENYRLGMDPSLQANLMSPLHESWRQRLEVQEVDVPSGTTIPAPPGSDVSLREGMEQVSISPGFSTTGINTDEKPQDRSQAQNISLDKQPEKVDQQPEKVTVTPDLDESNTSCEEVNQEADVFEEKYDKEYTEKTSQRLDGATEAHCVGNELTHDQEISLCANQEELVSPALDGKNVIVFAPTGRGKTIMLAAIMKHHLQEGFTGPRPRRILFLVNEQPLVEQQGSVLKRYLEPLEYRIIQLTGETLTYSLNQVVEAGYDVIVLSAHTLENALEDEDIKSLSLFTMMTFDECHHTQGETMFNKIMGRFCDMKIEKPEDPRPQIIGLTACLDCCQASTDPNARDYVLQICANLDAEMISMVVENKEELTKYAAVLEEGRNQDPDGKTVLLARNDTGVPKLEATHISPESMMYNAVDEVRRLSEHEYNKAIKKIQERDHEERIQLKRARETA